MILRVLTRLTVATIFQHIQNINSSPLQLITCSMSIMPPWEENKKILRLHWYTFKYTPVLWEMSLFCKSSFWNVFFFYFTARRTFVLIKGHRIAQLQGAPFTSYSLSVVPPGISQRRGLADEAIFPRMSLGYTTKQMHLAYINRLTPADKKEKGRKVESP